MNVNFVVDDQELLPRKIWEVLVKLRANYICEECGRQLAKVANSGTRGHTSDASHAHHKNHDPLDNRLANGECVCLSCHGKFTSSTATFKASVARGNKNFKKQKPPSEETKKKISETLKGRVLTEEWKKKISESHKKRYV